MRRTEVTTIEIHESSEEEEQEKEKPVANAMDEEESGWMETGANF